MQIAQNLVHVVAANGRHAPVAKHLEIDSWLWFLASRILMHLNYQTLPSFLLLAVHTVNDGKLDGALETRIVISNSTYEISCAQM